MLSLSMIVRDEEARLGSHIFLSLIRFPMDSGKEIN